MGSLMIGASAGGLLGPVLLMGRTRPPHPAGCPSRSVLPHALTPPEVAVNLKKVLTWVVVAFVLFYVIQQPEASAALVRNAGEALGSAASSLSEFVGSLV